MPTRRLPLWREFMFTVLLSLAFGGPVAGQPGFRFFEPVQPPRPVQVMAHRGLHQLAPENTRPALEACVADYLEWAEVDLRLTKDGRHIISHDEQLARTTDGKGPVSEYLLGDLLKLDAGSWFAPRFQGTRLLSFAQVLDLAKGRINLYLDCKRIDPELLAREVLAADMAAQVIVYADPATLARVRTASQGKVPGMTKFRASFNFETWIKQVQPAAVEINADEVTPDLCRRFHARDVKVQAKTLGRDWDRPEVWSKVITAGVDWIQTDEPVAVLAHALRLRSPKWPVQIAYHAGANRYAPENTVPALRQATRLGADYIEFDIRTTKDGAHVLLHDRTLDRTTNGKGPVAERTLAELAKLDAGAWFGRPFAGTRVPTLEEALAALGDRSRAYLDAKAIDRPALLAGMKKHGLMERSVVYQSVEYLTRLKQLDAAVRTLPPLKKLDDLDKIAALRPYGVDADWRILSKEMIERCHAKGIRVFSDALGWRETIEDYRRAIGWGIDVIQTDHPARVLRAIELSAALQMQRN